MKSVVNVGGTNQSEGGRLQIYTSYSCFSVYLPQTEAYCDCKTHLIEALLMVKGLLHVLDMKALLLGGVSAPSTYTKL